MNKNLRRFFFVVVLMLAAATIAAALAEPARQNTLLKNAWRHDENGWIFIHLEGRPRQLGFQQGWLLAAEIDEVLRMLALYLPKTSHRDWDFFRQVAGRICWPKLEKEYREEIAGIAAGVRARLPGTACDQVDITALNGMIELADYHVPLLDEKAKAGSGDRRAPGRCSAFIATGSWTRDGKIVAGHNNWTDYILGERWNVIADVVPRQGHRMLMDSMPGFIDSGDDFAINDAGLIYTETTISEFKGFREDAAPEFVRARRAAQYAASIDEFVRIMVSDNNGGYANDWLVGDLKTGEIARLELGLKNHRLWRTTDGYFVGSNFPSDEKLIAEETTFDPKKTTQSVLVRKSRWEQLMVQHRGRIDAEIGKTLEADHIDASLGKPGASSNTICGHIDLDPKGTPEFEATPFTPCGAVQAKVTTAALAGEMKMWARMGHPCGRDFLAAPFLKAHPEFAWQAPFLKDMPAHPWTLFAIKK